ncbi:MAG TPA: hypothetical protein VGM90_11680 [Kofleriaceae bacterium]|jgi:hypothetical protein
MKLTPKTIALTTAAALGTLGCFLPFVGGMTLSVLADQRGFMKPHLGMFLVPFLFLLLFGVLSLAVFKRVARWQGIVGALLAAALVFFLDAAAFWGKFRPTGFVAMITEGDIGAKLVSLGAVAALVTCLVAAVAPDPTLA